MATQQQQQNDGLFGMTPQEYSRARYDREAEQDLEFSKLPLQSQIVFQGAQAGRSLGKGLGTLMGGEDPELLKIQNMDNIFKNLSSEEQEDPAKAFSTVADRMGDFGYNKEAILYRMKALDISKQREADAFTNETSRQKSIEGNLKVLSQLANGAYSGLELAGDNLESQNTIWKEFIRKGVSTRALTPEDVSRLETLKPKDRLSYLENARKTLETTAQQALLEKQASLQAHQVKQATIKSSEGFVKTATQHAHEIALQRNRIQAQIHIQDKRLQAVNFSDLLSVSVTAVTQAQEAIKEVNDEIALWGDSTKMTNFTEEERNTKLATLQRDQAALRIRLQEAQDTVNAAKLSLKEIGDPFNQSAPTTQEPTKVSLDTWNSSINAAVAGIRQHPDNVDGIINALNASGTRGNNAPMPREFIIARATGYTGSLKTWKKENTPLTPAEQEREDFKKQIGDLSSKEKFDKDFQEAKAKHKREMALAQSTLKNPEEVRKLSETQLKRVQKLASNKIFTFHGIPRTSD